MGIEIRKQIRDIVDQQLENSLRYRCLLFQSNDISMFLDISRAASEAIEILGKSLNHIHANLMLDDVGAYSCAEVIRQISDSSTNMISILSGPLHFLDYWSEQQCSRFWGHLACIEISDGIIILDVIRAEGVQGTFVEIGRIMGTDIRYLKSRRAILEAHIG